MLRRGSQAPRRRLRGGRDRRVRPGGCGASGRAAALILAALAVGACASARPSGAGAGRAPAAPAASAAPAPAADAPRDAAPAAASAGLPAAPPAAAPHAHELADLTPQGPYPRFTPAELAASGYPDHMHAFFWPGWSPLRDAQGRAYGPGSLCEGGEPVARPDLTIEPAAITFGPFHLRHQPVYRPCDVMVAVELCDLARVRCRELLGVERAGTLTITSPDGFPAYQRRTGRGAWRLYALAGDSCVIQPVATLMARTLLGHALVEMTVEWELAGAAGGALPFWMRCGLAAYLADSGVHLNNFMAPLRSAGPVLLRPAAVDSILGAPPAADPGLDQALFRRASYSAFLMAWRLVEENGGFAPLRQLLARLDAGEDFAAACRKVYGLDPAALAARLDPVAAGEPIGAAVQPRQPHRPPGEAG